MLYGQLIVCVPDVGPVPGSAVFHVQPQLCGFLIMVDAVLVVFGYEPDPGYQLMQDWRPLQRLVGLLGRADEDGSCFLEVVDLAEDVRQLFQGKERAVDVVLLYFSDEHVGTVHVTFASLELLEHRSYRFPLGPRSSSEHR